MRDSSGVVCLTPRRTEAGAYLVDRCFFWRRSNAKEPDMPSLHVHTIREPSGELVHDVQADDAFRMQQATRALRARGYAIAVPLRTESGLRGITFWSLDPTPVTRVPPRTHSQVLKALGLPSNAVDVRTDDVYSTYTVRVRPLRQRRVRPTSPAGGGQSTKRRRSRLRSRSYLFS